MLAITLRGERPLATLTGTNIDQLSRRLVLIGFGRQFEPPCLHLMPGEMVEIGVLGFRNRGGHTVTHQLHTSNKLIGQRGPILRAIGHTQPTALKDQHVLARSDIIIK